MHERILKISRIDGVGLSGQSHQSFLVEVDFKRVKASHTYIQSDVVFEAI